MNRYALWIISAWVILSCEPKKNRETETDTTQRSETDTAYTVSVIETYPRLFVYPVRAQGKITPRRSVPLSFDMGGKLQKLYIRNGHYVKKGQLVAQLFNQKERLDLEEAEIALKKSEREFQNLLAEYRDSLRRQYWPRIRENLSLQAGVEQNQVNLKKAKLNMENTYLKAPFAGLIDGLSFEEGSMISPGEILANVQDVRSFEVQTELLEFDIPKLQTGDSAVIHPLYDPSNTVSGKVVEIDPRVKKNGYVTVVIRVPYQSGFIAGMSVNATMLIPYERSLVVPKNAVVRKSGKPVVFTVEDNKAKWNYVTLGKENGDEIQVLEGLSGGNQVVVSNNLQLAHDTPVRISKSQSSSD